MDIGFVGLGTMGAPMARNLLRAGFGVIVHNRTRAREAALEEAGARRAASPAAVAAAVEIVVVCVSDSPDVEQVVLDPDSGLIAGLADGALVIDCSTISPAVTRAVAAKLEQRGVAFVDAPVSGGSEGAVNATLAIMCGGEESAILRARPVLAAMGKSIVHVGDVGAGQIAKAANQVVIAGTYQSVAEALVLSVKLGADPRRVVEAIAGGAASSWVLDNRAANMIRDDYPLGFRLRLHRKDLAIALAAAEEVGIDLPVARHVAGVEDELITQGHGDEDMSAIARRVRSAAGLKGEFPKK